MYIIIIIFFFVLYKTKILSKIKQFQSKISNLTIWFFIRVKVKNISSTIVPIFIIKIVQKNLFFLKFVPV